MTRVAVLERFADPSRRYSSSEHLAASGQMIYDLFGIRGLLPAVPRALAGWLGPRTAPFRTKRGLLRACMQSRGTRTTRLGALVFAPELIRNVRRGEIASIATFSRKGFPLADFLSDKTARPPDELLAHGTQYFGELAFELLAVIPYAYWLHTKGQLEFTSSTQDTRCFYGFSPKHTEVPVLRNYIPITEFPIGEMDPNGYDRGAFPAQLDEEKWAPPPYKAMYRNDDFVWQRESCVISNKTSIERPGDEAPINYLSNDLLLEVIGRLRRTYQVIYNRPRFRDIPSDGAPPRERGDIEAVKDAFPDVFTIQELAADHPELTFNELQLKVYADCSKFVSVLGGGSYLASYFGGTNVVYARSGWEVSCGAYENWFHRFSGAKVVSAGSGDDLLRAIDRELL